MVNLQALMRFISVGFTTYRAGSTLGIKFSFVLGGSHAEKRTH